MWCLITTFGNISELFFYVCRRVVVPMMQSVKICNKWVGLFTATLQTRNRVSEMWHISLFSVHALRNRLNKQPHHSYPSVSVFVCVTRRVYHILRKEQRFKSGSGGVNLWVGGVYHDPPRPSSDLNVCLWCVCVAMTCVFLWVSESICVVYSIWQAEGRVCECALAERGGVVPVD